MMLALESALIIFLLRATDITLCTLRIFMMLRGKRLFAWIFGFCQSIVFVTAIQKVLSDMGNWANIVGYAAGFASGLVFGILIEDRLKIGFLHIRIISKTRGDVIARELRQAGYGVTEIEARGMNGAVDLLHCGIRRDEKKRFEELVKLLDENAFVTSENVYPVQRGFWGR